MTKRVYVFGESLWHAMDYIQKMRGTEQRLGDWVAVYSTNQLRGVRNAEIRLVGNYEFNPEWSSSTCLRGMSMELSMRQGVYTGVDVVEVREW